MTPPPEKSLKWKYDLFTDPSFTLYEACPALGADSLRRRTVKGTGGKVFPLCIQNQMRKARFQQLIYHISKADFEHQESDSWRLAKFVWQMTLILDKDSHSAACDRKPPWTTVQQKGREEMPKNAKVAFDSQFCVRWRISGSFFTIYQLSLASFQSFLFFNPKTKHLN